VKEVGDVVQEKPVGLDQQKESNEGKILEGPHITNLIKILIYSGICLDIYISTALKLHRILIVTGALIFDYVCIIQTQLEAATTTRLRKKRLRLLIFLSKVKIRRG
jgi:hypothetical protein